MQIKSYSKKLFILFIPIVMLCVVLSKYGVMDAEAASNRSIKIEEVRGTVMIQKNGGAKFIRAYEGMVLQQGDRISTNPYASLRLTIQDTNDDITISENTEFTIANLDEAEENKRTKLTIWNGSIWAKVTPLLHSKDKFEIGTPSSTMNVKGTNFYVGVDPNNGSSTVFVGSGTVNVSPSNQGGGTSTNVFPSQQVVVDGSIANDSGDLNIVDLNSFIANTSPEILEAILRSKAAIDKENEEYILRLRQDQQLNPGEINRINQNLQNLIGNILKQAIQQKKLSEQDIKELIKKINGQSNLDLEVDLDKTIPLQLTDAEKEKMARLQKLEEERKKKQEEEKRKQEQLKQQNQDIFNKLQEQLRKQEEQKKAAEEAARKKAQENLLSQLDEENRKALEEKLKALELEKKKQEAAAAHDKPKAEAEDPVYTPPSQPSENPNPAPSDIDGNLAKAKATVPVSSEHYTEESWSRIVLALGLGETSNSEKIEKTEAIKLAVARLITVIDHNLMIAKSSIPTNSTRYTPDTWERVIATLAMPETNDSEKVEKTEAIKHAVEGLVEIPIVSEIAIEELRFGTHYIKVHWAHFDNATIYEVYLNGELVRVYDEIMDIYDFTDDELQSSKSYTLEILALDESANILANKTINFETGTPTP